MLESTGLDAYMFVRMISMCFRVCAVLWLLAMLVVLPTNLVGSDEEDSFAAVSITSVGEGSNLMWVHTCVVYVVYGVALFMVYKLYLEYIELRHRFKAQRGTAQLTLLIEAIPPEAASTDTELRRLFDKYFPGKIHSATMVRLSHSLDKLLARRDALARRLEEADFQMVRTGNRDPSSGAARRGTWCRFWRRR